MNKDDSIKDSHSFDSNIEKPSITDSYLDPDVPTNGCTIKNFKKMDSMDIEEGKKIVKNLKINKKEITKKKKKIFKTKKLKDKKYLKF